MNYIRLFVLTMLFIWFLLDVIKKFSRRRYRRLLKKKLRRVILGSSYLDLVLLFIFRFISLLIIFFINRI